jgi:hypothetical protein
MLLTILLVIAAVLLLVAGLWFGLAYAMRKPALARRLMRVPPVRFLMAKMTKIGMRAARKRAERDGTIPKGRPVSDLELALAVSDTEEARQARAMLARLSPRQRNELSRRTMGADGLSGLLAEGAAAEGGAESLGRTGRRQTAGVAASSGRESARAAQRRKAVAKRRASRKGSRR